MKNLVFSDGSRETRLSDLWSGKPSPYERVAAILNFDGFWSCR